MNKGLYNPTAGTTISVPTRYDPVVPTQTSNLGGVVAGAQAVKFNALPYTPSNPIVNINTGAYYPSTAQYNLLSSLPGRGTPQITQTGFQTPATGTGSGFAIGQNPFVKPVKTNADNDFPGFWGGGKNGQFYRSLREARIATRRHRQIKAAGDPITPVAPTVTTGQDYSLTWRVG